VTSVIAGLLCLFLPETLDQKLPDTVEEAAKFRGYVINRNGVIVVNN